MVGLNQMCSTLQDTLGKGLQCILSLPISRLRIHNCSNIPQVVLGDCDWVGYCVAAASWGCQGWFAVRRLSAALSW